MTGILTFDQVLFWVTTTIQTKTPVTANLPHFYAHVCLYSSHFGSTPWDLVPSTCCLLIHSKCLAEHLEGDPRESAIRDKETALTPTAISRGGLSPRVLRSEPPQTREAPVGFLKPSTKIDSPGTVRHLGQSME